MAEERRPKGRAYSGFYAGPKREYGEARDRYLEHEAMAKVERFFRKVPVTKKTPEALRVLAEMVRKKGAKKKK